MVWALGTTSENGCLVIETLTRDGAISINSLEILGQSGVPVPEGHINKKTRIISPFDTWQSTNDPSEYLSAYGMKNSGTSNSRHQIFEFEVARTRFVVPSLVLMRSLFRPNKYLLPDVFKPQSLDKACFVDHAAEPTLVLHAYWASQGYRSTSQSIRDAFMWMTAFPSAYAMVHSVHQKALHGHIGMCLPIGVAKFSVQGIRRNSTIYVSKLSFTHIETDETPVLEFPNQSQTVDFVDNRRNESARPAFQLAAHFDTSISHAEWEHIGPILLSKMRVARIMLNQRLIFEDILKKISTGVSWARIKYQTGTKEHASRAYQLWAKSGAFDEAILALHRLRATPQR